MDMIADALVENLSALWMLRHRMVARGDIGLDELARFDARIDAHLDAAAALGPDLRDAAVSQMANGDGDLAFAVTILGLSSDPVTAARVVDIVIDPPGDDLEGEPDPLQEAARRRGLIGALAWARRAQATPVLEALAVSPDPRQRAAAVAARGCRRSDPGARLEAALSDDDARVRAAACRTAGQLGRAALRPDLLAILATDEAPDARFWAAWSAARLGATDALPFLAAIHDEGGARADHAFETLLRCLDLAAANDWLRRAATQPGRIRQVTRGVGIVGDPIYLTWLLERMEQPALARLAGEAFTAITGADLVALRLDSPAPPGAVNGPTDDPDDEDVEPDPDDGLPWPNPVAVTRWWRDHRGRFAAGTAHLLGQPKAASDLLGLLVRATQRHRAAAAFELALRQPGAPVFEVRARAALQRRQLAAAGAAVAA